jgi:hypothetical protein
MTHIECATNVLVVRDPYAASYIVPTPRMQTKKSLQIHRTFAVLRARPRGMFTGESRIWCMPLPLLERISM